MVVITFTEIPETFSHFPLTLVTLGVFASYFILHGVGAKLD